VEHSLQELTKVYPFYRDILELKEIQRSLPSAQQEADPLCSRPQTQYLKTVPLALLPLLPETYSCGSHGSPPVRTSAGSPTSPPPTTSSSMTFNARPPPSPWQPAQNHLGNPVNRRPRPHFPFLPLLDTPPSSTTSSRCHSPAISPPSSPRTFAEFEASLDGGHDNVLHHVPPPPAPTRLESPSFLPSSPEADPHFRLPPRVLSPPAEVLSSNRGYDYFPPSPHSAVRTSQLKRDKALNGEQVKTQTHPTPNLASSPLSHIPQVSLPPAAIAGRASEAKVIDLNRDGSPNGHGFPTPPLTPNDARKATGKGERGKVGQVVASSSANEAASSGLSRAPNSGSEATTRAPPRVGSKDATSYFSRTLSPPPSTRATQPKPSKPSYSRELPSPSAKRGSNCVSMARRESPCSSPVIVPLSG
jgi:hypothetical protein